LRRRYGKKVHTLPKAELEFEVFMERHWQKFTTTINIGLNPGLLIDTVDPRSTFAPNPAGIFPWGRAADGLFDEPMEQNTAELGTLAHAWATEWA
jgi:hypothetical protein